MKVFSIQIIFLMVVIIGALFYWSNNFQFNSRSIGLPFMTEQSKTTQVILGNTIFQLEIADSAQSRAKGLGGRENLASGSGMLFVFPKSDKYRFWMKDMQIPIDILYIQKDKVVDIIKSVPPPAKGVSDDKLPLYESKAPSDQVVELNAGEVDKYDIKIGDSFQIIK